MAFQVSPGVNVSEIDATNVVPAVSTSDAGFAAAFVWGPADKITTITSEVDLVNTFGKPDSDTQTNWYTAASFLAYAGSLQIVRTLGATAYNSSDGTASGVEGVVVDVEDLTPTPSAVWQASQTHAAFAQTGATNPAGGTGATFSAVTDGSGNPTFTLVAAGTGYNSGDELTFTDPGSSANTAVITIETVTASSSAATIVVTNEDAYDAHLTGESESAITAFDSATFVARYAGELGDSIQVGIFHQTGTLDDWKEDFTQNGKTATVTFGDLFDRAPNTSAHVLSKNGGVDVNDEIHIVVVDRDGKISGTAGKVLEKFAHVSLATDARSSEGNSNYYRDVLRNNSKYIYATGQWDLVDAQWESKDSTNITPFNSEPAHSILLANGGNDNTSAASTNGNHAAKRYVADKGYYLFRDVDSVDVGLLITGQDDASGTLAKNLIDNVAEYRKDAVVFYSISNNKSVNNQSQSVKGDDLVTYMTTTINKNSSYAVMDSGWKRTYNRYTDNYVDVPLNGDIAGLCVATDQARDAWWSPAGFNRGQIKNVVKLWFNPDKAQRDKIYKVGVNPVVAMPGAGTILYGDKTSLQKPSAFDRINVRRLFIVLEKAISRAAKFMLFEFNDEFTRSTFRNMVEPFLGEIKAKRGIYDYKVVCDTSNNTGEVIDRNEFVGDIYVKPARSINFIQLNFVAVRTGVDFSEVAG